MFVFKTASVAISIHNHDSRKEPQKLQKEGTKEEGVSRPYFALENNVFIWKFLEHTLLPKKNGTMSMYPPYLMCAYPPSPQSTRLLVKVKIFEVVLIIFIKIENSADSLKGRVFEVSLADLNRGTSEEAWRKVKVQIEEVKGYDCYTNFYGLDVTKDKLCTLVKKWHTLIEAFVQTKTVDGFLLRLFCIGFT